MRSITRAVYPILAWASAIAALHRGNGFLIVLLAIVVAREAWPAREAAVG